MTDKGEDIKQEIDATVNMIKARLDRLADKLADPAKRLPEGLAPSATITEQLRTAIQTSGLSYRQLAEAAEMDHVALGRFVAAKKDLNGQTIDRLAKALGLELTEKP